LTRVTAVLAAVFMTTSILLVVMHNRGRAPQSIMDQGAPAVPASPTAPAVPPAAPAAPTAPQPQSPPAEPSPPSAPLAR
jgi:preprotein translocase subunit SecG